MMWAIVLQPKHTIEAAVPDSYFCVAQSCSPCAYNMDMCMIMILLHLQTDLQNFQLCQ